MSKEIKTREVILEAADHKQNNKLFNTHCCNCVKSGNKYKSQSVKVVK